MSVTVAGSGESQLPGARADANAGAARALAWLRIQPAWRIAAICALWFLPFTEALTLQVKFPLKGYELLLLVVGAIMLAEGRLRTSSSVRAVSPALVAFLAWTTITLALRLAWPAEPPDLRTFPSRFGPTGDGIAKLIYLFLSVFGFLVFARLAEENPRLFVRAWLAGAVCCVAYTWYLFGFSLIGVTPPLLPGNIRPQRYTLVGIEVIRSGSFTEGNFLGLYLVLSTALAIHVRRLLTATLLGATVFITFSTVNVVGLLVVIAGLAIARANRGTARRRAIMLSAALLFIATVLTAMVVSGYATQVIFSKLTLEEAGSALDRLNQIVAGIGMVVKYPVMGVGLSQYGFHYTTYQLTDLFDHLMKGKPIPNNVYVELAAELGLVGLALFGYFLRRLWRRARRSGEAILQLGMLAVLLAFNAYPTYTLMFLWAYFAYLAAAPFGGLMSRSAEPAGG